MANKSPDRQIAAPVAPRKTRRPKAKRLVSLDAFRGFIMIMLAASGFGIARLTDLPEDNQVWRWLDYETWSKIGFHFRHPPWESVHGWATVSFWDLIQPAFMLMVGVAMPFSYAHRSKVGDSLLRQHCHAIRRALILVLMGVFLYSLKNDHTNWVFTNVLAQIGLGYYFAYLLLGRSARVQFAALVVILVGTWTIFKFSEPPADYDYASVNASVEAGEVYEGAYRPWSKNGNAAHFFDVWLLNTLRSQPTSLSQAQPELTSEEAEDAGATAATAEEGSPAAGGDSPGNSAKTDSAETAAPVDNNPVTVVLSNIRDWWFTDSERFEFNGGGYATLSFLPSIATTLLGILCGQLLMQPVSHRDKILYLLLWASLCLGFGLLAHHTVCPIVKRIWTPSWVLFSGGYCIALLLVFYVLFDALPLKRLAFPLIVVGMNSIMMYLMGQMLRPWVIEKVVGTHFGRAMDGLVGYPLDDSNIGTVVFPTAAFVVFWLVALWMYRRKYFVRV